MSRSGASAVSGPSEIHMDCDVFCRELYQPPQAAGLSVFGHPESPPKDVISNFVFLTGE